MPLKKVVGFLSINIQSNGIKRGLYKEMHILPASYDESQLVRRPSHVYCTWLANQEIDYKTCIS